MPSVALIARQRAIDLLQTREPRKLVAVHQMFEGDVNGRALLIFPETRSLELVRAVTKQRSAARRYHRTGTGKRWLRSAISF